MKATLALLILVTVVSGFGWPVHRKQAPAKPDDALLVRQKAIKNLYDAQEIMLNQLAGKGEASTPLESLLTSQGNGQFYSIDRQGATELFSAYKAIDTSESADSVSRFFIKNRELRRKYAPPFAGTLADFWQTLEKMAGAGPASDPDKQLLQRADDDSLWILRNLGMVGISDLDPKARESFTGLFQLLSEYQLTRDRRILVALAEDLNVIRKHCESTGQRADQETQFSTETIDVQNARVTQWIVTAISLRGETKRIGDPSTPVIGRLVPGKWFFFAQKGDQRSAGEWHTVQNGKLEPANILIRLR